MPNTEDSVDYLKNPVELNLSAFDGLTSKAAYQLKLAIRDMVAAHGLATTKSILTEVVSETTTPAAPTNSVAPSISGTTTVGQTLTCAVGTWAGTPALDSATFQWLQADTAGGTYTEISGATANTYVLAAGQANKYVKCDVTRKNKHGELTVRTAATAQIAAA